MCLKTVATDGHQINVIEQWYLLMIWQMRPLEIFHELLEIFSKFCITYKSNKLISFSSVCGKDAFLVRASADSRSIVV